MNLPFLDFCKQWRDRLQNALFVPRCIGCDLPLPIFAKAPICDDCRTKWEKEKRDPCQICGRPFAHCHCLPYRIDDSLSCAYALAPYQKVQTKTISREMVLRAKTYLDSSLCVFLAQELVRVLPNFFFFYPQQILLTYVPRTPKRVSKYGYDQAQLLAQEIAKILGCAVQTTLVSVTDSAQTQKECTLIQRFAQAEQAYAPASQIDCVKGKQVLLVDDVLTSGATAFACAKILKAHGAHAVFALTLTKTPK